MMDLVELNRRFRIIPTSLFHLPRDLSETPLGQPLTGDCQDYARTAKRVLRLKWYQAMVIRCWSDKLVPRHAVLWVFGRGFIDSTHRDLRRTPLPHIPVWPVGTPALAITLYSVGTYYGWFSLFDLSDLTTLFF